MNGKIKKWCLFLALLSALTFALALCACGEPEKKDEGWGTVYNLSAAYSEARELGYAGTLEEFIAMISGKDGKDGENGKDGKDGKDGEKGEKGENGKDGINGKDGEDGKDGKNGKDGADGADGKDGENGLSAYEIYKKYHPEYSGSEEEWIDDLINGNLTKSLAFTLSEDETYYTLTGIGSVTDTTVVVPETYKGKPVKKVAAVALKDQSQIKSLTIPSCVTSIGFGAFEGCSGLEYLSFPYVYEKVQFTVQEIEITHFTYYFVGETNDDFSPSESTLIKLIRDYIPKGLKTVSLTGGTIAPMAFEGCDSLTSVTIGDGVTSIGREAFFACFSLTEITIPDSVTSICEDAFYNCDSLVAVYIFDLSSWCKISFKNSSSNPLHRAKNLYLNNVLVTELTIPDDVTNIGDYAFQGCSSLTSITIPDNVTSIGSYAFEDCTSLTSVTIPESVTEIGRSAFSGCSSLKRVYYKGTASDWEKISISSYNSCLTDATRYYYSETKPTGEGNYWHYDTDGVTVLEW